MCLPENNSEQQIAFTFDLVQNWFYSSNYTRSSCSGTLCTSSQYIWGISFL